jgi:2-amino-4-hydroxy-6-hydroxymethyldihydropteridine diphosphokinase
MMENIAYLSLGSNMGNRYNHLTEAIQILRTYPEIQLVNFSSIYETDPVGYEDQDLFLNMVIKIKTNWSAEQLLEICLKTESELGRKREIRWGPRTVDLDILLYNQDNIKTEKLMIPHPRMLERAFVITPLLEICQSGEIPGINIPINQLPNNEGVRIWKQKSGEDVFEPIEN